MDGQTETKCKCDGWDGPHRHGVWCLEDIPVNPNDPVAIVKAEGVNTQRQNAWHDYLNLLNRC